LLDQKVTQKIKSARYAFLPHRALAAKAGSTTGCLVFAVEQTVLCLLAVQTLKGLLPSHKAIMFCPPFAQKLGADAKKKRRYG
jgi:hypothetical protein